MNIENGLSYQIKESYKRLVAEKVNGGICPKSMGELLDLLTNRPGMVEILKQYVEGTEIRKDYKIDK
ncbi:MAG: hypothetical protein Q7R97_02585 [Candidatus Daviesbacteria bacterium]|nr:hypothetical protein [Candidatus Daviesbacteria bacterium]